MPIITTLIIIMKIVNNRKDNNSAWRREIKSWKTLGDSERFNKARNSTGSLYSQ